MVFCRILHYFVAESFFVIYVVLSRNMFLAIHALLRGEKFNKKFACGENMTNMRYALVLDWITLVLTCIELLFMDWIDLATLAPG